MATPRSQRVAIWVIAIVLAVGTIGSFFVLIIANRNDQEIATSMQKQVEDYQAAAAEAEQKQAKQLSDKYYKQFSGYKSRVAKFNSGDVKKLETKDLKKGSGETIEDGTPYHAYYIGWNPRGVIFDSSLDGKALKAPLDAGGMGLIEGWTKGVIGMKKGGVRELTIPANMAYGETGQGEDIAPNTPLKFIVMAIEDPEPVEQPEMSDELIEYLIKQQGY